MKSTQTKTATAAVRCFSCKKLGHFARVCPIQDGGSKIIAQQNLRKSQTHFFTVNEEMIDIGANLTNRDFTSDLNSFLARSKQYKVTKIIITGTSLKASKQAISLIKKHKPSVIGVNLYSTVGIHPHDASSFNDDSLTQLQNLSKEPNAVAIGECGLDYNRMFSTKEQQIHCFRKHLELAKASNMPLFCHERDAHEDFMRITGEFEELPPLVVHCFTGKKTEVEKYVAQGFYIGFTGTICMQQRGEHLRQILSEKIIPSDRLMIETDAPFMSPVRSVRKNEPAMLGYVCKTMAECYDMTPEEMAKITSANATAFFQLPQ